MRNYKLLKHCAVLVLALLLVAGALTLSGPEDGPTRVRAQLWLQQHGLATPEPGLVMVLQQSEPTGRTSTDPDSVWASLARLGVEQGDLLEGDSRLVRVPQSKLAEAQAASGSALRPYEPKDRLAQSLSGSASTPDQGVLTVNVTVFGPEDKGAVVQTVRSLGGTVLRGATEQGRVLRLLVSGARLGELAKMPAVVYIEPVQSYRLMNDRARDLVAATPLGVDGWLSPSWPGLTGAGQIIGLADSGLDKGSTEDIHPDLASVPGHMPKVAMLKSWAGAPSAADPNGHGTHMAATIAGTGSALAGRYQGLAPGASIYFQGLTNSSGQLDPPPDLTALFTPAYEAGVRIHVNGWGGENGGYQSTASQIDQFIRKHPDFLAIFSAGNNGPGAGSLTSEAYTKNGLVVGASQSPHPVFDPHQVDGNLASDFSSRGPTGDGRLKPELLAPGALISAKARQVTSEFNLGDGYYTYMEGTSMAAAAAGGSAALLREYLIKYEQVQRPTAVLLKAALICGADTPDTGPARDGFGVLDLGGTVLALHENTFQFVDNLGGVANGGTTAYTSLVQGDGTPFKATLAWTDPAVAPGVSHPLVNNLDLVVRDPAGKVWLGNSFMGTGKPDDANNAEQVYIPHPTPGVYTISVKGTNIAQNTVSGASRKAQDFALVYGQPLARGVVESGSTKVALASGAEVGLDKARVSIEQDGKGLTWPVAAGADAGNSQRLTGNGRQLYGMDIYLPPATAGSPDYAYLAGRTWQAQGVQLIAAGGSILFTEINSTSRSGGFLLAPKARSELWANGSTLADPGMLPPGGEIRAIINPSTQTLWGAEIAFQESDGLLDRVDLTQKELFLVGKKQALTLAPRAALAYIDEIADSDQADIPYGAGASPAWDKLLPGLRVRLMLSPGSGEVMYVGARRRLAVGTITGVDPAARKITLSSGHTYKVGLGVSLQLDEKDVDFMALSKGQHTIAVLFPETQEILALSAYSQVLYAQVIYVSADQQSLLLNDDHKTFHNIHLSGDTQFFRWGLPARVNTVEPGSWARLYVDPGTGQARRLDLAEAAPEKTEIFSGYDPKQMIMTTDAGTYQLTGHTMVTKNGYPVAPEDLKSGEEITVAPLLTDGSKQPLVASVAARTRPLVKAPSLDVAAPWRSEYVVLSGITSADRLYLYLPGNGRWSVPVVPGKRFHCQFQPTTDANTAVAGANRTDQQGMTVQLVAVNTVTGGVTGQFIDIPAQTEANFSDLKGHWALADVEALLAQHLVSGYPDGLFRPEATITRAEFVVLLTGALGWPGTGVPVSFADAQAIPGWARQAVGCGVQHGLIHGEQDGRFYPNRPITRAEVAVLLDQALQIFAPDTDVAGVYPAPPWSDWPEIPGWAQPATVNVFNTGILVGRTPQSFAPLVSLKRGEAAAVINHLLEYIRKAS